MQKNKNFFNIWTPIARKRHLYTRVTGETPSRSKWRLVLFGKIVSTSIDFVLTENFGGFVYACIDPLKTGNNTMWSSILTTIKVQHFDCHSEYNESEYWQITQQQVVSKMFDNWIIAVLHWKYGPIYFLTPRLYQDFQISDSNKSRWFNINQFGHLSFNLYVRTNCQPPLCRG